jgi:preprotein translocase subunit Sss1
MVRQIYFLHYRLVTEVLFAGLTICAAGVIGYLILLIRL